VKEVGSGLVKEVDREMKCLCLDIPDLDLVCI